MNIEDSLKQKKAIEERISKLNTDKLANIIVNASVPPIYNVVGSIAQRITNVYSDKLANVIESISTPAIHNVIESMGEILRPQLIQAHQFIQDLEIHPNSLFAYRKYIKFLKNCYWAFPYGLDIEELYILEDNGLDEKNFDQAMLSHFSNETVKAMFENTAKFLTDVEKVLFEQICSAYWNEHYCLINSAIISLIDCKLSIFLADDKDSYCQTKRNNLLEVIITHKGDSTKIKESQPLFIATYLSNNINKLFDTIYFNQVKEIDTEKQSRRHLLSHGRLFINEKIDSLMLLNSLNQLVNSISYFIDYHGVVVWDRKKQGFFVDDTLLKNK